MDYIPYDRVPHRFPNDMEHAFVVRPHEECCPDDAEECVCVTSGDVEKWNNAYDSISAISSIDPSAFSALLDVSALSSSADFWNGTYETVSSNSAGWDKTFSAVTENSSLWNESSSISSIASTIADIQDDVSALEVNKQDNIYFDKDSIIGDGTQGYPYQVREWQSYKNLREDVDLIHDHIVSIPSADGHGELFTFDGSKLELEEHERRIMSAENQLKSDSKNINNLSSVAMAASSYAKQVADNYPTYKADEITIHRSNEDSPIASGVGNTYVFSLKSLPVEYTSDIKLGVDAYERVKKLEAMNLVGFRKTSPYPKAQSAISGLISANTIYYTYEG